MTSVLSFWESVKIVKKYTLERQFSIGLIGCQWDLFYSQNGILYSGPSPKLLLARVVAVE
jgi:hypothetical protein